MLIDSFNDAAAEGELMKCDGPSWLLWKAQEKPVLLSSGELVGRASCMSLAIKYCTDCPDFLNLKASNKVIVETSKTHFLMTELKVRGLHPTHVICEHKLIYYVVSREASTCFLVGAAHARSVVWFSLARLAWKLSNSGVDLTAGQQGRWKNIPFSKWSITCCQLTEMIFPHVAPRGADDAERQSPELSNQWVTCQSMTSHLFLLVGL